MSARYLADYMAASEQLRRTIVRGCKYQPIAKLVQHDEAKAAVAEFICGGAANMERLREQGQALRNRLADTEFERDLFDHNADYISRFAEAWNSDALPTCEISPAGDPPSIRLHEVSVGIELHFRTHRTTRRNTVKVGAGMLRYAKGKALAEDIGQWQSAFLFGYLSELHKDDEEEPEKALCITFDAYAGMAIPAPSDSIRRFNNMAAACATIAERWGNIEPPPGAVI